MNKTDTQKIPVLHDVVRLGDLVPEEVSPPATPPQTTAGPSATQLANTAHQLPINQTTNPSATPLDPNIKKIVKAVLPTMMPELEQLAKKKLIEFVRLQQQKRR